MLVYAHRSEFPKHRAARAALGRLTASSGGWCIPVFVVGEFIRVVTHPKMVDPQTTEEEAVGAIHDLLASAGATILMPGDRYWALLSETIVRGRARGNIALDAQIVAVCREHGVGEILTEDRDFARFPWIQPRTIDEFD